MKKHILSQNVRCVFDTVKHILFSHSRPATQRENLRIKVPKTDDSVGVSIYTPNSQISQKSVQNGVPVGRPFRTFLVSFCNFLVSGVCLDSGAPQVGTNILPGTDFS